MSDFRGPTSDVVERRLVFMFFCSRVPMRIITVNKYYYDRGGTERYLFLLADLLTKNGHTVIPFAMEDPKNRPTPYATFFVSPVDFGVHARRSVVGSLRATARLFWSREAAKKFDALLTATRPDVIHLHNIYHHLSPSILSVARRHGVPVVMSVHDYQLVWPDYVLCGYVRGVSPLAVVRRRCIQGSYAKSALVVAAWMLHRMFRLYDRGVRRFIVPSNAMRDIVVEAGLDAARVAVVPHPLPPEAAHTVPASSAPRRSLLYMGRLSREKGVDIFLRAMHTGESHVAIRIAGDGPERGHLERLAAAGSPVTFLGHLDRAALDRELDAALAVVVPSVWQEPFGFVVLEAFARGVPVIASRIGALPELVDDGITGFLVPAGDARALREKIDWLIAHPAERAAMGERARASVRARHNADAYLAKLLQIYDAARSPS